MTTDVDTTSLDYSEDELKHAGLRPDGWYLFTIQKKRVKHIEGGVSKKGNPYDAFSVVQVTLLGQQQAEYNENGEFQGARDIIGSFWADFELGNRQWDLDKLKTLYKGATGQKLTGRGNVESTIEEILGRQVWARVYHREDDNGELQPQVDTRRFRSVDYGPPATISVRAA